MNYNYIKLKREVHPNKLREKISECIKTCRELGQSLWVLSYMELRNDKIWFKGFGCTPNGLLQEMIWPEQVVPGDHFIIDLTNCLDTIVLKGGITSVGNPGSLYWTSSYNLNSYTE